MLFRSKKPKFNIESQNSSQYNVLESETLNTNFLQCNQTMDDIPFYFTEHKLEHSGLAHMHDTLCPDKVAIQFFEISILGDHQEKTELIQHLQNFEQNLIKQFNPDQITNMPKVPHDIIEFSNILDKIGRAHV